MATIPANQLVSVNPSVLNAVGDGLDVVGLVLTDSTRVPMGTVASFSSTAAVSAYFGPESDEAIIAGGATNRGTGYFGGFEGSAKIPANILFAQYNEAAVAAFLRGGDISSLTLTALQALSGTLTLVLNGVSIPAGTVSLSAATSFSSAASIIQAALVAGAPSAASVTGSIGGIVTASAGASFTATGSGTNLTVSAISGVLHLGAAISGTGVPSGTYIVSQTSGTAGSNGVYVTNHATTSVAASITAISNTLDVTGVTSGTIQPTDAISGTGVGSGVTVLAQISGAAGGIGLYTISAQKQFASTAVTALSTVLNVTVVGSGTIEVGALLAGTSVTSGTIVTANLTGAGGVGTYTVSLASTTISETITSAAVTPTVAYDSTSGALVATGGNTGATSTIAFATGTLAASIKWTSATGAVISQGAAAASPATFMDALVQVNSNWVCFMTSFDPDATDENTVKLAFAAWNTEQNNRFVYVCPDLDQSPTVTLPATGSLGYLLAQNSDSGTVLLDGQEAAGWDYDMGVSLAAFVMGAAAAVDFEQRNGRISFAYRMQDGMLATVTDQTVANNLGGVPRTALSYGNGYNFYGAYGTANPDFIWFQRGLITGAFRWIDSYINQVWMNNAFQIALLSLFQNARSIPYTTAGYGTIEAALNDPIQAALNFGVFAPGPLSNSQIAQVNGMAGASIADTLQTQGYYLQIVAASAAVRQSRTSPTITFWYIDRGAVQALDLSSVALT